MKQGFIFILLLNMGLCSTAQQLFRAEHALMVTKEVQKETPVYKLKPAVDIPLTAVTAGWTLYAFTKVYHKDPSTQQQIQNLRIADVNGFDRWAAGMHSEKAANTSDIFFYTSMPLPLLLLADKDIRSDAGKIGFLYLEAMSVTGLFYSSATTFVDRYRPLAYDADAPPHARLSGNAKNAFFAGHVALVGTSTFFAAKVFSDYHPTSKLRYVFWGAATVATGATGYLRYRAGKHFPSDILVGSAVAVLSGVLVPQFHKVKLIKNENLTIVPFAGPRNGLAVVYHL